MRLGLSSLLSSNKGPVCHIPTVFAHMAELIVDDTSALSKTAAALAAYTKAPAVIHTLRFANAQQLRLPTPLLAISPKVLKSPLSLFAGLLALTGRLDLLGSTAVQRAQISSWLEISRELPREQFIARLEEHMDRGRDFLVEQRVTVADFVAFPYVAETRSNQLLRWVTHMRNLPEISPFVHTAQTTPKPPTQPNNSHTQAKKPQEQPPKLPSIDPFIPLNLCVGRITRIWKHPTKDRLYCQEVNIGAETYQIASGLVGLVPESALLDSLVVVLTNLKPRRMGDFVSRGMLLCASCEGVVEPLRPPTGAKPGDLISIPGLNPDPLPELPPKKTYWEQASERMLVSSTGEITYDNQPLQSAAGPIVAPTLRRGKIS